MLEKLKSDIITLEAKYDDQVKLNKTYQEELESLRNNARDGKSKEILENEKMLKLEITNLNNNINFRIQENELLKKENQILNEQLKKYEKIITELSNNDIPVQIKHEEKVQEVHHQSPKKMDPLPEKLKENIVKKEEEPKHEHHETQSEHTHKPPKKTEIASSNVVEESVSEVDKMIAPPKVYYIKYRLFQVSLLVRKFNLK